MLQIVLATMSSKNLNAGGGAAGQRSCKKLSLYCFLGFANSGQKRLRRREPNSPVFNAEIFNFAGSPSIPFEQ